MIGDTPKPEYEVITDLVHWGPTGSYTRVVYVNSTDIINYQDYPDYGTNIEKSNLQRVALKCFNDFLSTNEEAAEEEKSKISYGFTYTFRTVPNFGKVLCYMPLLEGDELNPHFKQYYRKFITKKNDRSIVKFVHGKDGKIKFIYHCKNDQEDLQTKDKDGQPDRTIAALGLCDFPEDLRHKACNAPTQGFDMFRLLKLEAEIKFYSDEKMYEADREEFLKRIKAPPKGTPPDRINKIFFGNITQKSLIENLKGIFGK